jgi:hypothetical protein
MRKLLIILFLLILALPVQSATMVSGRPCPGGVAGCTSADKQETDNVTYKSDNTGYVYFASDFVAGSSYSLDKISLKLSKSGSPTANLTVHIYSESSSKPNASLGESGAIASSTLTTSAADYEFTFASAISITSGTHYWVVLMLNGNAHGTNYVKWHGDSSTANGGHGYGRYTTSWSGLDSSGQLCFINYACE